MEAIYYPDAWYKVIFELNETNLKFKCFKIKGLDLENAEDSECYEDEDVEGIFRWDGTISMNMTDIYWGNKEFQDQFNLMMEKIIQKGELIFDVKF